MNLKQFRYVLTLADEGSFSRAAEALNIRQPSLSQYIKKVEREVGMELFDRSGGDVRLTDAGRAYIDIGRKMLDLEHQLEGRFSDLSSFKSGTISIGISAHRSVALMPPIVAAFKSLYPGITLRIVERYRADLMDAAEHGEFDLVITTLPVNTDLFTTETVFVEENVVATRNELKGEIIKTRRYPVVSASSLDNLPFAMLNEDHLMQRELNDLVHTHNLYLKKEVECTSLEALVEMVKAGIGAAFIPACLAKDQTLHYYSIRETIPKREIVLVYRKEQYLSKAVVDLKQLIHTLLE
jgi:DNA-binding transcriptional LysR family regulator